MTTVASLEALSLPEIESRYRPYLQSKASHDWTAELELDIVKSMTATLSNPIRLLVLYGSLRER